MKSAPKIIVASACALAFSGAILTGCSSSSSDQQILDKLNQMEAEISQLQEQQSSDEAAGTSSDASASNDGSGSASAAGTANGTSTDETDFEAAIADLETRAASAVADADAVAVPQNQADRPQAYFDAKAPLETLQNEADALEDQLEAAYRQGSLDRDTFWSYDNRVSAAEDSLDTAEDQLERRMGVDD